MRRLLVLAIVGGSLALGAAAPADGAPACIGQVAGDPRADMVVVLYLWRLDAAGLDTPIGSYASQLARTKTGCP